MKTIGWMLSLLGSVLGGFTAWAQGFPHMRYPLALPHGPFPGFEITGAASLLAFLSVAVMWTRYAWAGSLLALVATVGGLFGADQLWTTAACVLFCGAILTLFAERETTPSPDL